MDPLTLAALAVFGVGVGIIGAMIGAGGGFIVVPVLVLILELDHKLAVGTSSAVVAVSSATAVTAYLRQGRVDRRLGIALASVMLPGLAAGVWLVYRLPGTGFKAAFGGLLLFTSIALVIRNLPGAKKRLAEGGSADGAGEARPASRFGAWQRRVKDAFGIEHAYSVDMRIGVTCSAFIGLLPSLFGVGGGIVQTPVFVLLLGVPMHVAAATSQMIIAITSLISATTYLILGQVDLPIFAALAVGVFVGAPIGATLARRAGGRTIAFVMAVVLGAVGVRMILSGIGAGATS